MNFLKKYLSFLLMIVVLHGCGVSYSFTGANINSDLKTFYIPPINNRAAIVQPTLAQTLNDQMRQKFQTQTPLRLRNSSTADLVFEVSITDYVIEPVVFGNAGGQAASRNRLKVTMAVNCINNINAKDNWQQTFTPRFAEFESSQDLTSIETKLLEQICAELADDIFNKSFVNW